jgi:hypothetical protein
MWIWNWLTIQWYLLRGFGFWGRLHTEPVTQNDLDMMIRTLKETQNGR